MSTGLFAELNAAEENLVGYWLDLGSGVEKDAVWERIDWLASSKLEFVDQNSTGSEMLYRDPADGRYWELTRRAFHLRGGGPPILKVIGVEDASRKYNFKNE